MPARKTGKAKTPQPVRGGKIPQLPAQKKTPKSAPPPRRTMKLVQDEDEELLAMTNKAKGAILHQKKTPKKTPIKQMQEEDDYMSDEEDMDMAGMDDFDEDVDDDDSEEDGDEDAGLPPPRAGQKRKLMETLKQPVKETAAKQTPARMQAKKQSGAAGKAAATPKSASKVAATLKSASKIAATPNKGIQESKKTSETPKLANTPTPAAGKALAEREIRTLFIKNLPMNVTEVDIKALSPDIRSVRIRVALRKKMKSKAFAFLEFASEKVAEKNYAQLKDKRVKDNKIYVDYCGEKSTYKKSKKSKPFTGEMDPLRLYISGFPLDTKVEELQRLIPKAVQIDLPRKKRVFGFAFAKFTEAKDAAAALQKHNGTLFKEQVLIMDQARQRPEPRPQAGDKRKTPESKAGKGPNAKKAKVIAEEVEDEDEDEEDEDEDEEDEDEDEEDEDEDEEDEDEDEEDEDEDEEDEDEDEEDEDEEDEDEDEDDEEDEENDDDDDED